MEYTLEFPEERTIIINGETINFEGREGFELAWSIKACVESLEWIGKGNESTKFQVFGDYGNQCRRGLVSLHDNEEMERTAKKIIKRRIRDNIVSLKALQK